MLEKKTHNNNVTEMKNDFEMLISRLDIGINE